MARNYQYKYQARENLRRGLPGRTADSEKIRRVYVTPDDSLTDETSTQKKYIKAGGQMYDTVVIKSPEIDPETVQKILTFCRIYEGVDIFTGELLYRFTSGDLEGSYDYRIRIKVDNTEWIKEEVKLQKELKRTGILSLSAVCINC